MFLLAAVTLSSFIWVDRRGKFHVDNMHFYLFICVWSSCSVCFQWQSVHSFYIWNLQIRENMQTQMTFGCPKYEYNIDQGREQWECFNIWKGHCTAKVDSQTTFHKSDIAKPSYANVLWLLLFLLLSAQVTKLEAGIFSVFCLTAPLLPHSIWQYHKESFYKIFCFLLCAD